MVSPLFTQMRLHSSGGMKMYQPCGSLKMDSLIGLKMIACTLFFDSGDRLGTYDNFSPQQLRFLRDAGACRGL